MKSQNSDRSADMCLSVWRLTVCSAPHCCCDDCGLQLVVTLTVPFSSECSQSVVSHGSRVHGGSVIMWLQQTASAWDHQHASIVHHTHTPKTHTHRKVTACTGWIDCYLLVWFWSMTDESSFFLPGDAFPAGSSPFLSGYPGPSPLTSDPAFRSTNPSSLQMAQLWASHAHEGKSPSASTNICISLPLFLSLCFSLSVQ